MFTNIVEKLCFNFDKEVFDEGLLNLFVFYLIPLYLNNLFTIMQTDVLEFF